MELYINNSDWDHMKAQCNDDVGAYNDYRTYRSSAESHLSGASLQSLRL